MKILVTGANGFVGKNLVTALKQIKNGNDKTRPLINVEEIYEFDRDDTVETLSRYCADCDFVFNLAGVNRPKSENEFVEGNCGFLSELLMLLEKNNNNCPIVLSSSIQASLEGRYKGSLYGESKLAAEQLLREYARKTGARILIYRFPNLFGKWCRPNYNSAVATFCYNYAHDLPIQVNDPKTELELVYIDDLVTEMLNALEGKENRCEFDGIDPIKKADGSFCFVPVSHKVSLAYIVECLDRIKKQPETLIVPELADKSFIKKLYSTYLSYLPIEKTIFDLPMHKDDRGSFTELVKTVSSGQFSVNISKPGITKGQHFHNTKWEFFIVVKGKALITERNLLTGEVYEFTVDDTNIQAVHMLPGFTHAIKNLSNEEELITLMWANEIFDPETPDTFHEEV